MRRMKTRTENEKQQNASDRYTKCTIGRTVNDLARYGELMSPETIKRTQVFMQSAGHFCWVQPNLDFLQIS